MESAAQEVAMIALRRKTWWRTRKDFCSSHRSDGRRKLKRMCGPSSAEPNNWSVRVSLNERHECQAPHLEGIEQLMLIVGILLLCAHSSIDEMFFFSPVGLGRCGG